MISNVVNVRVLHLTSSSRKRSSDSFLSDNVCQRSLPRILQYTGLFCRNHTHAESIITPTVWNDLIMCAWVPHMFSIDSCSGRILNFPIHVQKTVRGTYAPPPTLLIQLNVQGPKESALFPKQLSGGHF